MFTAIYSRVSSEAQDTRSQMSELKKYADAQRAQIVWFKDRFTGKTMERPGWSKLMDAVHAGRVNRIVSWRLDRLGRTAKGLTALFSELVRLKVNLVSLRDHIDLNTASGKLMAHVLASVAEYETEIRAERVRAGQAAARAAGKTWGGSKKGRMLVVTPEQIKLIKRMKAEGDGISAIARATGLSRPTVYARLA